MSISSAKGMLARLKHLERSRGATDEMRGWVSDMLSAAIADGRMCPVDGPVVRHCVLNWIDDGTARAGTAGWGFAAMKPNFQGFVEPRMWPQDGGTRREPVLDADHKPPRVVRYVGWRKCMRCGQLFWSEDVQRLRLCTPQPNRQGCRSRQDDDGI